MGFKIEFRALGGSIDRSLFENRARTENGTVSSVDAFDLFEIYDTHKRVEDTFYENLRLSFPASRQLASVTGIQDNTVSKEKSCSALCDRIKLAAVSLSLTNAKRETFP